MGVVIRESSRRDRTTTKLSLDGSSLSVVGGSPNISSTTTVFRSVGEIFVPHGYPDSVSPDYKHFQTWDSIQGLCSYLRGILTTHAMLKGVGVGSEAASAMAATIQWIYKDGASMIGGLLFTWVGTNYQEGTGFDANVKGWRLFADVINDVGLSLELVAPLFPSAFTSMICIAGVFKSLCGIAAGSTRAALTSHFALCGNVADVAAKESTQETAVATAGMLIGLQFTTLLHDNTVAIWGLFIALTVIHVIANYIAVTSLLLRTINAERLKILIDLHRSQDDDFSFSNVSKRELVWPRPWATHELDALRFGVSLQSLFKTSTFPVDLGGLFMSDVMAHRFSMWKSGVDGSVFVVASEQAVVHDVLVAHFLAVSVQFEGALNWKSPAVQEAWNQATGFANTIAQTGWQCDRLLLRDEGFRVNVEE